MKCPIKTSLGVLGKKWTMLIIRDIGVYKIARFNRLLESIEGIAPRVLSMRLKELEKKGFIERAEEAAKFYTSIFKNSKIIDIAHYGESAAEVSGRPKGTVMTVTFELEGQQFIALNGGPIFKFTPAISFLVSCETQQEVDNLWEKLSERGEEEQCGWLKDKFGVSWQIVPSILAEMIHDKDANKSERVIKAMLQMKKLDIQGLRKAYEEVDTRS